MIKNIYLIVAVFIIAALAGGAYYFTRKPAGQVACTMEAKLCADGSYVGRTGPNCEFAPCPSESLCEGGVCPSASVIPTGSESVTPKPAGPRSVIKGEVTVGPICPVERLDSPCPVPAEAYTSREVILYAADGTTVVQRMHFNADGAYQFVVPAGNYVLDTPRQGIGGSKDLPKNLTVKSGETINFDFSIDTGIR